MHSDHEHDELQSLLHDGYGAPPLDKRFSAELVERLQAAASTTSQPSRQHSPLVLSLGAVAVAASILALVWIAVPTDSKPDTTTAQRTKITANGKYAETGEVNHLNDHQRGASSLDTAQEVTGEEKKSEEVSATYKESETYKAPGQDITRPSADLSEFDDLLPGGSSTEIKMKLESAAEQTDLDIRMITDRDTRTITRDGAARLGWKITVDEEKDYVRFTVRPPAALLSQGRTAYLDVRHDRKLITSCIVGLHERKQGSRYEFAVSNQYLAGATFELGPAGLLEGGESYRMHLDKFIDQP